MAVGGREKEYDDAASGVPFHQRGKQFDAMLGEMERAWRGDSFGDAGAIGPAPPSGRPAVVIGGTAEAAFRRAAHFDGWVMGGGTPDMFRQGAEQLQILARRAAGRDTAPRTMALAYFALGDRVQAAGGVLPARLLRLPRRVRRPGRRERRHGCGDGPRLRRRVRGRRLRRLVLFPCDPDPAQVDLLAYALA